MRTIRKGLEEIIFEGFDWSDHLEQNETIAESEWTIDFGLTPGSSTYDQTSTEIELSGGTQNDTYKCQNRVTTTMDAVYEKSFKVMVIER